MGNYIIPLGVSTSMGHHPRRSIWAKDPPPPPPPLDQEPTPPPPWSIIPNSSPSSQLHHYLFLLCLKITQVKINLKPMIRHGPESLNMSIDNPFWN